MRGRQAPPAIIRPGAVCDDRISRIPNLSFIFGTTLICGYTYLWEFLVEPEQIEEFERHYGPDGTWAALLRQSPGYIETLLLRDLENSLRFITIDRWESADAYQSFRSSVSCQYAELDERCQYLTTRETSLGHYDEAIV